MYFFDEDYFALFRSQDFLIFSCFFIPVMLLIYYIVILAEDERPVSVHRKGSFFSFKIRKKKGIVEGSGDSEIERNAYDEALKILDRARADSLKILGRAQSKAQGLLDNTYVISKESRKKLEDSVRSIYEKQEHVLDNLSEELLENYKIAVEEGQKENIRTLYEVTEAMRKEAIQGVDELKNVVKKETMEAQDALEEKITTEYAKVGDEIKEYRSKKIESLNKKIFELLSNIHSEVLNEDLDQIKHEKLILELLDREIKKSGLKNVS